MNIKTIIVDLDRTLLHTDKTISSYTAKVLKECKKNAIRIMVATARPLRAIKQYLSRECSSAIESFDAVSGTKNNA